MIRIVVEEEEEVRGERNEVNSGYLDLIAFIGQSRGDMHGVRISILSVLMGFPLLASSETYITQRTGSCYVQCRKTSHNMPRPGSQ